jgi:hypothetical protein
VRVEFDPNNVCDNAVPHSETAAHSRITPHAAKRVRFRGVAFWLTGKRGFRALRPILHHPRRGDLSIILFEWMEWLATEARIDQVADQRYAKEK